MYRSSRAVLSLLVVLIIGEATVMGVLFGVGNTGYGEHSLAEPSKLWLMIPDIQHEPFRDQQPRKRRVHLR